MVQLTASDGSIFYVNPGLVDSVLPVPGQPGLAQVSFITAGGVNGGSESRVTVNGTPAAIAAALATGSTLTIAADSYTPSVAPSGGVVAGASSFTFQRIGNVVMLSGFLTVNTSAALANPFVDFSVPPQATPSGPWTAAPQAQGAGVADPQAVAAAGAGTLDQQLILAVIGGTGLVRLGPLTQSPANKDVTYSVSVSYLLF